MLRILDQISTGCGILFFICFLILVCWLIWQAAIGFRFEDYLQYTKRRKWPLILGLGIVLSFTLFISGQIAVANHLKKEIQNYTMSFDPLRDSLIINGGYISQPRSIISDLQKLHQSHYNHTSPYKYIRVEIKQPNQNLIIMCGRDDSDSSMFWIYSPLYKTSSKNDIGQLESTELQKYF